MQRQLQRQKGAWAEVVQERQVGQHAQLEEGQRPFCRQLLLQQLPRAHPPQLHNNKDNEHHQAQSQQRRWLDTAKERRSVLGCLGCSSAE